MRNAKDDLEICGKASPGPWRVKTNAHRATRGGSWGWIEGPRENWCWADERPRSRRDADFIAMAREALPYWIERAERLERALEHACVLITNHVNAYGTGMDLPMDLLANSRKPEAWKKYFMEEDSR